MQVVKVMLSLASHAEGRGAWVSVMASWHMLCRLQGTCATEQPEHFSLPCKIVFPPPLWSDELDHQPQRLFIWHASQFFSGCVEFCQNSLHLQKNKGLQDKCRACRLQNPLHLISAAQPCIQANDRSCIDAWPKQTWPNVRLERDRSDLLCFAI